MKKLIIFLLTFNILTCPVMAAESPEASLHDGNNGNNKPSIGQNTDAKSPETGVDLTYLLLALGVATAAGGVSIYKINKYSKEEA